MDLIPERSQSLGCICFLFSTQSITIGEVCSLAGMVRHRKGLAMLALVVENQPNLRRISKRMLEQMTLFESVEEASDAEVGWKKLTEAKFLQPVDLVLCEVDLPGMDGLALLNLCRKDPELRYTPFIMLAELPQESVIAVALGEYGANDFIVKPFSFEILEQRVVGLLKSVQSQEERLFRYVEELKETEQLDQAVALIGRWEEDARMSRARWSNLKGECLMRLGRTETAALAFEKAMQVSDIYIRAYKNFATANLDLGHLEKAIDALKHVDDIAPVEPDRSLYLGKLMIQAGRKDDARECLHRLMNRAPKKIRQTVSQKVAETFLSGGLYVEAEAIYEIHVRANPEDIDTYNKLGIALRQQGKYEEAEGCYLKALQVQPRHAGLYHNLGVLQMARRDYLKAVKCFKKANMLNPLSEETKRMLDLATERHERKQARAEAEG